MSSAPTLSPPAVPDTVKLTEPRQQRSALAVAMLGFAIVTLDGQIVNVALPSIHNALGCGLSGLQWIVTAYTLMFSSLRVSHVGTAALLVATVLFTRLPSTTS